RPARSDSFRERALGAELDLQLATEKLPLELFVLPHVAGDDLLDLLCLEEDPQAQIGGAAVVRDQGDVLCALPMEGGDQVFRISAEAEASAHQKATVVNVAHRLVRAANQLVHP